MSHVSINKVQCIPIFIVNEMHINYFIFEKKTRKKNRMQKKKEKNRMQQFPFQEKNPITR